MKLLKLKINNFKGISQFILEPNGENCRVYGANGAGKTTLADAYFWLLFGKDSNGNTNFNVKTNGTTGLECCVEVDILLDSGEKVSLIRKLKEKWERKRGEAEHKMIGNTTDYMINGVPKKQKEYREYINNICTEQIFSYLTNPDLFAEKLHWKSRREILVNAFASDVSDKDIIKHHESLQPLCDILNGISVLDFEVKVKLNRDKINKRLKELPIEINAYNNAINEFGVSSSKYDECKLKELKKHKSELEKEIQKVQNNEKLQEIRKQINDEKCKLSKEEFLYISSNGFANKQIYSQIESCNKELITVTADNKNAEAMIAFNEGQKSGYMQQGKEINKLWKKKWQEEFDGDTICPTCGQAFPMEQLQQAKEHFNKAKSEKLESYKSDCEVLKAKIGKINSKINEYKNKQTENNAKITNITETIQKLKGQITEEIPFDKTEAYKVAVSNIERLEEKLQSFENDNSTVLNAFREKLKIVEEHIETIKEVQAINKQLEFNQRKIEECRSEQRNLGKLLSEHDEKLNLTKAFMRFKANDIEATINDHFKLVKWKMFNEQVNGGLEDCCEATVNGISYNDGLNNASKVNAGLDIINVLSEIYCKNVPVWIDNAESVTDYIDGNQQRIYLYVSVDDKNLKVVKE